MLGTPDGDLRVQVRVAKMTFHLVERLNLPYMAESPAFWMSNVRGWYLLGLDHEPMPFSRQALETLVELSHVRQALL